MIIAMEKGWSEDCVGGNELTYACYDMIIHR